MTRQADSKPWYNPKRDGTLDDYFAQYNGQSACPLFKGHVWFEKLRDLGYLMPDVTIIRIMWSHGRSDEHYRVTSDFKLEGIVVPMHGGRPGIHDPKEILDCEPGWTPQNILSTPALREMYRREKR